MSAAIQTLVRTIIAVSKSTLVSQEERDDATASLVKLAVTLQMADQDKWSFVTEEFAPSPFLLLSYAKAAAVRAVRTHDLFWLKIGIIVVLLDDLRTDWRESLMMLSLIGKSARILGQDQLNFVSELVGKAGERCFQIVNGYFAQPVEQQSIALMGYKEAKSLAGFSYVPID